MAQPGLAREFFSILLGGIRSALDSTASTAMFRNLLSTPPAESSRRMALAFVFDRLEALGVFRRFWATYRALWEDTRLSGFDDVNLKKAGYLPPLRFNLYQSALTAAAATAVTKAIEFFYFPDLALQTYAANPSASLFELRYLQHVRNLAPVLVSGAAPLAHLLCAAVAGIASLRRDDWTISSIKRQTRAFLFLDGYYGFFPQLIAATILALGTLPSSTGAFLGVSPGLLYWVWFPQLLVNGTFIPRALFEIAGYSSVPRLFPGEESSSTPPRAQYIVTTQLVIPILVLLLYAVLWLFAVILSGAGALAQGITSGTGLPTL